jgi:uncharacterized repeat protein (TIGR03803 family)
VFQVNSAGVETLLHSFSGPDGDSPGYGNLVRDLAGNLYGATQAGGTPNSICSSGCGTVFKLDMAGELTTLYDFMGQPAGVGPNAGLLFEKNVLYGTTAAGGASNVGTVFEVNAKTGKMSVLYSFGGADGGSPVAGLIGDGAGNLYGTTRFGGLSDDGVVFMLTLATRQYTVLHSFSGLDGAQPFAALIRDSAGNLYGTTWEGGASPFPGGYGTVFKLDTSNNLTTLYSFTNEADGSYPSGGLAMDSMGRLYGSAGGGGSGGWGTIFEITP